MMMKIQTKTTLEMSLSCSPIVTGSSPGVLSLQLHCLCSHMTWRRFPRLIDF